MMKPGTLVYLGLGYCGLNECFSWGSAGGQEQILERTSLGRKRLGSLRMDRSWRERQNLTKIMNRSCFGLADSADRACGRVHGDCRPLGREIHNLCLLLGLPCLPHCPPLSATLSPPTFMLAPSALGSLLLLYSHLIPPNLG